MKHLLGLWCALILGSATVAIAGPQDCDPKLAQILGQQVTKANQGKRYLSLAEVPDGTIVWKKYECTGDKCGKVVSAKPGASGDPTRKDIVECPHCFKQHTTESYFYMEDASGNQILDVQDVAKTKDEVDHSMSGKKISCASCGHSSFANEEFCSQCTTPLQASLPHLKQIDPSGKQFAHSYKGQEAPDYNPKDHRSAEEKAADFGTAARKNIINAKPVMIAATIGLMAGGGIWALSSWAGKTHEVKGEVNAMSWKHELRRERFEPTTVREWRRETKITPSVMPIDGHGEVAGRENPRDCKKEFHHNRPYQCGIDVTYTSEWDTVDDGTETYPDTEPYQVKVGTEPYMEDLGNGSAVKRSRPVYETRTRTVTRTRKKTKRVERKVRHETPRMCDEPIYWTRCTYDTYTWKHAGRSEVGGAFPASGQTKLPWPSDLPRGPRDRIFPTESYSVTAGWADGKDRGSYPIPVNDESEFLQWKRGDGVVFDRNNLGTMKSFRRAK